MGTLQQELTKVQHLQSLDSMSFDDDDTEQQHQQPAAEPGPLKRGMTSAVAKGEEKAKRHLVWDWVREHPACVTAEVAEGMNLSPGAAATIMYKLYDRGLVTRTMHNGNYTYCTAVDEYPVMSPEEKVRRMMEANALKHASKTGKRKYTKRAAPARAAAEKSAEQRRQVAVAPTVGQGFVDSVQAFINSLTVHQAKAVYEELRKVFGDFK